MPGIAERSGSRTFRHGGKWVRLEMNYIKTADEVVVEIATRGDDESRFTYLDRPSALFRLLFRQFAEQAVAGRFD